MTSRAYLPFHMSLVLALALLLCGFVPRAGAQGHGVIAGAVTDPNGAILQGAQIAIQNPSVTASTNEHGRYYINDLAPGTYNLTITYLGLNPLNNMVTVNPGQTTELNARLQVPNAQQAVVVNAGRASAEAAALNVERAADNYLQFLPVEVISSLPSANMAGALGPMPSVNICGSSCLCQIGNTSV
jgi:hypothetical protein